MAELSAPQWSTAVTREQWWSAMIELIGAPLQLHD
jgi:hypothetical protein